MKNSQLSNMRLKVGCFWGFIWLAKYDFMAWFDIIKYKYVKEIHFRMIFLAKKFVLSMIIRIFVAREPAKPLNDAQMCGSFLFL